jgi:hypothetical protein
LEEEGSRAIIVVVQVGAVKIYGAAEQSTAQHCTAGASLRKKETQDETQFTTKIGGKKKLGWVAVISFCK